MFTFSSSNRHCSNLLAAYIGLNFVDPIRDNACFDFWQKMQFWVNCWPNSALPDICWITAEGWCNPAISVDLAPTSHQKPTPAVLRKRDALPPIEKKLMSLQQEKKKLMTLPLKNLSRALCWSRYMSKTNFQCNVHACSKTVSPVLPFLFTNPNYSETSKLFLIVYVSLMSKKT